MNSKGILYCDFDGTLIKEDIETAWLNFLIEMKALHWFQYILAVISIPVSMFRKKQFKSSLFKSWSVGMSLEKKDILVNQFLQTKKATLNLNIEVLNYLKKVKDGYDIVILTGSDELLVRSYLEYKKIDKLFTKIIATKTTKSGFFIKQHPYGKDKCKFIDTSKKTIGIANEFADSFYLEMCDKAFIVKGDTKLMSLAKKRKWEII